MFGLSIPAFFQEKKMSSQVSWKNISVDIFLHLWYNKAPYISDSFHSDILNVNEVTFWKFFLLSASLEMINDHHIQVKIKREKKYVVFIQWKNHCL